MVGTAVRESLLGHELITPAKHELNIGNFDQIMKFAKKQPGYIIHLASETDHEYCEQNPSQCYFVNTIGTYNMVNLAHKLSIPIIYISTASIFDGNTTVPYNGSAIPNPINHYNRSKWLGEIMVRSYRKHFILRCGWMFGGGPNVDKKFVKKIIDKVNCGEKRIKVCDDCVGSPTYSMDVAEVIGQIIDKYAYAFGTYNCVNRSDGVSRYEFAKEIIKCLKKNNVRIMRCKIDDLKEEFPCKRTNYEVLRNSFDHIMRDWKPALKEYINAYNNH